MRVNSTFINKHMAEYKVKWQGNGASLKNYCNAAAIIVQQILV